jgi:hypothetical protein
MFSCGPVAGSMDNTIRFELYPTSRNVLIQWFVDSASPMTSTYVSAHTAHPLHTSIHIERGTSQELVCSCASPFCLLLFVRCCSLRAVL